MLYYLFDFLDKQFHIPGAGLFKFTSFRAGMAVLTALFIAMFFGKIHYKIVTIIEPMGVFCVFLVFVPL